MICKNYFFVDAPCCKPKSSNHHVYRRHSIQVLKPCSEQEKCLRRSRSVCSQNIFCGCNHRPSRLPQSVDTKNQKYRQPAKKSRPRPSMPQGNLSLSYPTILVSFPISYFAQQGYSRGENYYFFREIRPPSWSLDASESGESTKFPCVEAVGLIASRRWRSMHVHYMHLAHSPLFFREIVQCF